MQSDPEIATHGDEEVHGGKNRLWMYWISFGVSTLIFLFVTAAMLMVPGVSPSAKIECSSIAGLFLAVSLCIGIWRPTSTDAPVAAGHLAAGVAVILLIESAMCVLNIIGIALHPYR